MEKKSSDLYRNSDNYTTVCRYTNKHTLQSSQFAIEANLRSRTKFKIFYRVFPSFRCLYQPRPLRTSSVECFGCAEIYCFLKVADVSDISDRPGSVKPLGKWLVDGLDCPAGLPILSRRAESWQTSANKLQLDIWNLCIGEGVIALILFSYGFTEFLHFLVARFSIFILRFWRIVLCFFFGGICHDTKTCPSRLICNSCS